MANKAEIEIRAKDKTRAAFEAAETNMAKLDRSIGKLTKGFAVLAGATGIGLVIKKSLDAADAIGKAADAADIGVESLQELRFAADQSGVSTSQLDDGMRRFARRLGLAADGGGPAAKAFEQMGIAALGADGKIRGTEHVLNDTIGALARLDSQAERAALASAFFGDDAGPKLALLLKQGEQGIADLRREARELGLVLSEEGVRGAEAANDKLSKLEQVLTTKVTRAVVENAEALENLADSLITVTVGAANAFNSVYQFSEGMGEALAKLTHPVVTSMELIDTKIESTRKQIEQANHIINNDGFLGFGGSTPTEIEHSRNRLAILNAELEKHMQVRAAILANEQNRPTSVAPTISSAGPTGGAANDSRMQGPMITDELSAFGESQAKLEEKMQQRLDSVALQLMTEEERLSQSYVNREMIINEAFENGLIEEERRKELLLQLNEQYNNKLLSDEQRTQQAMTTLWNSSWQGKLQITNSMLGQLSNLMQSSSKKQFEIGKKAALAGALIDTYSAAASGFATKPFFPLGLAMGSIALANGFTQVNAIKSQQFGGGSGAVGTFPASPNTGLPTGEGGGSPGNVAGLQQQQAAPPAREVNITLSGTSYTRDQVRELIEQINEETGDGVALRANVA